MLNTVKDQKGFGHIGIVFIIVIIALVGLSGWFVWRSQDSASNNEKPGNTQQANEQSKAPQAKLCYVVEKKLSCYENASSQFAKSVTPVSLNDLSIERVVPSPNDDRLAILANRQANGNMDLYITSGKDLRLTKLDLGGYVKSTDSLAWLKDQSALIFEASPSEKNRVIVKLTVSTGSIQQLTKLPARAMNPVVVGDMIAYEKFDLAASPVSAWQWHAMQLDGSGDKDLGVSGYSGVSTGNNLLVASTSLGDEGRVDKINLVTGSSEPLGVRLKGLPSAGTGSNLTYIGDEKIAYFYSSKQDAPSDTLVIANFVSNEIMTKSAQGSWPFSTTLL